MEGSGGPTRARLITTIDRSVVLSELLFAAAVVAAALAELLIRPDLVAHPAFMGGFVLVAVTLGVTIMVQWSTVPPAAVVVVPVLDLIAVGVMRAADHVSGLGLLWVFPTIWLASYFGIVGVVVALGTALGFIVVEEVASAAPFGPASIPGTVLVPIALAFVGVSAALTSRRTRAVRTLIAAQARQLERALKRTRRQEELLSEVLDAVEFGVVRLDRDGRRAIVNRAYARMYGLDRRSLDEASEAAVLGGDRVTPLAIDELPFNRAVRGEQFDDVLTWVPSPGGELAAISVTARALVGLDGEDDGSVLVARDVTGELAAVRARDDLVASVSHELRTPMTSILGYVDLSVDEPGVPERVRQNLEIIERNGERMLQLIASILAGAKHRDQQAPLDLGDVDLGRVVLDCIEALRPRADEQRLSIDVANVEPVVVRGDAFRLRQVLDNLVSNAIKYNRLGGSIQVAATAEDGTAWVTVRDTGIGIPAAELPKLFERFFRSAAVQKGAIHGSGLGLPIAKDLVEMHGGGLHAESVEGSGTTMIMSLPVAGPGTA
ncbi:sensor histidine kinase [Agromyces sp. MMS24-K17]|uniref:sensor histidine kinase n=1 Tax=Agromyces sp. MMS24-K17 TaxID=3372850 RepID=UPI003754BE86